MLFPEFWRKQKSKKFLLKYLLFPASLFWRLLLKLEFTFIVPQKSSVPVICIGNITIGGNGKTPTAMKVRSLLKDLGYNPHILSRGYKSKLKGPHLVNPAVDSFLDVGDEPLMMSLYGPTWIARDRRLGVKSAILSGADIVILDDGFQNNSIVKDLSILVIETSIGFGNGCIIPAGPLRESISAGLKKADIILTIGEKNDHRHFKTEFSYLNLPISIHGEFQPKESNIKLKGRTVVAFSGIGHPKKFQATLEKLGAKVVKFETFENHKPFKVKRLNKLISDAKNNKAILITTEKDYVKIPKNLQNNFCALAVDLDISNQKLLLEKLRSVL